MSPRIERLKAVEQLGVDCFIIDLLKQETELDISLFDEQLRKVSGSGNVGQARFIVANDKILVTSPFNAHDAIYFFSKGFFNRGFGTQGNLQCAGIIDFDFSKNDAEKPKRKIHSHSTSLVSQGLRIEDSDKYKQTILMEALGEHFVIE